MIVGAEEGRECGRSLSLRHGAANLRPNPCREASRKYLGAGASVFGRLSATTSPPRGRQKVEVDASGSGGITSSLAEIRSRVETCGAIRTWLESGQAGPGDFGGFDRARGTHLGRRCAWDWAAKLVSERLSEVGQPLLQFGPNSTTPGWRLRRIQSTVGTAYRLLRVFGVCRCLARARSTR